MTAIEIPRTIVPNPALRKSIEETSGQKISNCFQCGKCTNGCPITFAMDVMPHKLMHLLQFGQIDEVLNNDTIWLCASCETCTTRCPNDIDIAHVMDSLRQLSNHQKLKASQHSVPVFHAAFLNSLKRHGRVHETEVALAYLIKDSGLLGILKLGGYGFAMFLRGKIQLIPNRIKAIKTVKNIFRKAEANL
jgi:heterodisulfide reductase subunit C